MADVLLELANVADDVPVHDLHMVHVKQQLEVGQPTFLMASMQKSSLSP